MTAAAGAQFFDVAGMAVSLGAVPGCAYPCAVWWSDRKPEPFSELQARAGRQITEQQFRELIYLQRMGW